MSIPRKFLWFQKAKRARVALATCALGLALGGLAWAEPTGPTVRQGQVTFTPGTEAQIQQLTDKAIVDWRSFSIGAGESVRFLQPSALSTILNRVTGTDPSIILGLMQANGNVFLINPNGILFGPNSVINVGGLVASSLSLSDEDFLRGNYRFSALSDRELGAVVNQGKITVADGGYAILTGPGVFNEGVILAKAGKVVLAAGETATINLDGRDLIHFAPGHQVGEGTVMLAPGMLSQTLADTLGVAPGRQANQLVRLPDGRMRLVHSSGTLVQAGTVAADGAAGVNAGEVLLTAADLTVVASGSKTSASGIGDSSDGGRVRVLSSMDGTATAHGFTDVQPGSLLAAGSRGSGDAGFIEVSGDSLNLHGDVDLNAVDGSGGSFLLDPVVVRIVDGEDAPTGTPSNLTASTDIGDEWFENFQPSANFTLQSAGQIIFALDQPGAVNPNGDTVMNFARGGTSRTAVTLIAGADPNEVGDIDFGQGYSFTGLSNLMLDASGDILFHDAVVDVRGGTTFSVQAGGKIDFGSANIDAILSKSSASIVAGGDIDLGTSDIFLDNTFGANSIDTNFTAGGSIRSGPTAGGSTATQTLKIDGITTFAANGGDLSFTNSSLLIPIGGNTGGASRRFDMTAAGGLTLTNSVFTVEGPWAVDVGGAVTLQSGSTVDVSQRGDFTIDAGGEVRFGDTAVNQNVAANQTGGFSVVTPGNVDFDQARLTVDTGAGSKVYKVDAGQSVDFGESVQTVQLSSSAVATIKAGADIDLGTSSLDLDSSFGANGITTEFTAGGSLRSGPTAGGSTAAQTLKIDGITTFAANGGDLSFTNTTLFIPIGGNTGGASRRFDMTAAGGLTLTNSVFTVEGPWAVDVGGAVTLQSGSTVDVSQRGDFTIDAGGDVRFGDTAVNQNVAANQTGGFSVVTPGNVDFDQARLTVDTGAGSKVYKVDAGQSVDFGESVQTVQLSSSAVATIKAGADIDLGTSSLDLDSSFGANGITTDFTAGGALRGGAGQQLRIDGVTDFAADGDIALAGTNLFVPIGGNTGGASRRLGVVSNGGSITLGDSVFDIQGPGSIQAQQSVGMGAARLTFQDRLDILAKTQNVSLGSSTLEVTNANRDLTVLAGDALDLGTATLTATNRMVLAANGSVQSGGSGLTAPDIEVVGFDTGTFTEDPSKPVAGPVSLSLSSASNIDLSVYAEGDISVGHSSGVSGTGTLSLERLGTEGAATAGDSSLRSVNGDIALTSDGVVNLGKGNSDFGQPVVWAEGANSKVTVGAGRLVDTNAGNSQLDLSAGALATVTGATGTDPVEVSSRGIKLDTSTTQGAVGRINIVGNSDFLEVRGDDSDLQVTELSSGNSLRVSQVSGKNVLTVDPMSIQGIYYAEKGDLSLGLISVGAAQTLAVEATLGGSLLDGRTTGANLNSTGSLLLLADGDVGETGKSVLLPGGQVAVHAGGSLFLESDGPALTVSDLTLQDPGGATRATASGLQASGDVRVEMTSTGPAQLSQNADIGSNTGGVAVSIKQGDLVQSGTSSIKGKTVALKVGGNVGTFDAGASTEVNLQAQHLVLDVQGDAILKQAAGDLDLSAQGLVGGTTYNATGAGGDLRVVVESGGLALNSDLTAGGEAALVTGKNLDIQAQALPGNITLNGNLTAGQSLAVLSGANIVWQSGTLTSPKLGLGAKGTVGTQTGGVSIATNQLALNPQNGVVNASGAFITVPAVTSVGVTVNQGVTAPTPPPDGGNTGSNQVTVDVTLVPLQEQSSTELFDPAVFSQNSSSMVEDFLSQVLAQGYPMLDENDPTRLPLGWFNDEDFLRHKFRRK